MEVKKTSKKKRISRHKKGHWKKQIDITDVEEHLEDQRLEERIGKPSEKPDSELFFQSNKSITEEKEDPIQRRADKPLQCYKHLLQEIPLQPAFDSKGKARVEFHPVNKQLRNKLAGYTKKNKEVKFKHPGPANRKRNKRIQSRLDGVKNFTDLWGDNGKIIAPDDVSKYHLEQTKTGIRPLPLRMRKKTSKLAAVEVPHPGASYNPTMEDHQDLLHRAHKREVLKDEEAKYIERNLRPTLKEGETLATEESKLEEMSEGLFAAEEESEAESDGSDQYPVHPKAAEFTRVTRQRRKKRLKVVSDQRKKEKKRERNVREGAVYRLKTFNKELNLEDAKIAKKLKTNKKREEQKKFKAGRTGRLKYKDADVEVNLTEELSGSLRAVNTEGHPMMDRYKSLQRRNIIEPRVKQTMKRKYKLKKFTKRGYKMGWEETPMNILTQAGPKDVIMGN